MENDVENKTHIYYACIGFRTSGVWRAAFGYCKWIRRWYRAGWWIWICEDKAKDSYFQLDDSDADFFYLDWFSTKGHSNSISERARGNKNGGKKNYNSLQLLNINRKQWNKHYWITLTGLKKKHAKRSWSFALIITLLTENSLKAKTSPTIGTA